MSRPRFSRDDKERITQQWNELFPSMGKYQNRWLGNTLGPLFVGLHLHMGADMSQYRPILHFSPLFLDTEYLPLGIQIKDGLNYVSTLSKPDKYMLIAQKLHELAIIPLEGDVGIDAVIKAITDHCIRLRKNTQLNSEQERFAAINILVPLACWSQNKAVIKRVISFAEKELSGFGRQWLQREFTSHKEILRSIIDKSSDVQMLRANFEHNLISLKMQELPHREIII